MTIPVLVAVSQATLEYGSYASAGQRKNVGLTHLGETGIEDSVRNLIGDLVRVTLTDRLGGEEEAEIGSGRGEEGVTRRE